LFAYECQFDRGGMDPQSILAQIEDQLKQEREQKNGGRAPSPGYNYPIKTSLTLPLFIVKCLY
jgi:hypothetical protein